MPRQERGDRGLGWYFDDVDQYGITRIEVSDSSSAEGPHCWLRLKEPQREHLGDKVGGNCAAHLDTSRATAIRDALDEWLARVGAGPVEQECPACKGAGEVVRVVIAGPAPVGMAPCPTCSGHGQILVTIRPAPRKEAADAEG